MTAIIYATKADLEIHFGRENISKWAAIDSAISQSLIESRINWALSLASRKLDNMLGGALYEIPFELEDSEAVLDAEIIENTCRLAALALYEPRGAADSENTDGTHKLSHLQDLVERWAFRVKSGKIRLTSVKISSSIAETVDFNP